MIGRLGSRTDSGRPDGREDGAVEGSTILADPLEASTALVPFVSPNEPHAPRTRSGSRRKRTDGKDDSVPESSSRQLVLTPNHSRQEYLEYLLKTLRGFRTIIGSSVSYSPLHLARSKWSRARTRACKPHAILCQKPLAEIRKGLRRVSVLPLNRLGLFMQATPQYPGGRQAITC